ncbi:hypothetical protein Bca52824_068092 [Brassica carinata]|uniref:Uncharacterized protein n=1 Tax=Brassica carinata TaxID=52824 RepID=A0A8X7Q171_BRACI|nr:hypothetical protein Bca52824_068092 [Brassica carinata]
MLHWFVCLRKIESPEPDFPALRLDTYLIKNKIRKLAHKHSKTITLDRNTSIVVPQDRDGLLAIDVLDPDQVLALTLMVSLLTVLVFAIFRRLQEIKDLFAEKLESVYKASGEKNINIFDKYGQNWIAIAAPFRGMFKRVLPGYIISTLLNGMSFVTGWEHNFFVSKWSMHQLLIECPSIYELMCCPYFKWELPSVLELWQEKESNDGVGT